MNLKRLSTQPRPTALAIAFLAVCLMSPFLVEAAPTPLPAESLAEWFPSRFLEASNEDGTRVEPSDHSDGHAQGDDGSSSARICVPVNECEMCFGSGSERSSSDGCETTGRRQEFECTEKQFDAGVDKYTEFRSCRRTVMDEQYLMLRMQGICLFIGILSSMSVRRQKLAGASLFDQRRRGGSPYQSDTSPHNSETEALTKPSGPDLMKGDEENRLSSSPSTSGGNGGVGGSIEMT